MIEIRNLSKTYGPTTAVDDLTVTVAPGVVTGFLGPNGAGKSTTMRMVVGLDRPTSGEVLVHGRRYAEHGAPLHHVGALLDAQAVHPGRTPLAHLRALAATHGIGRRRVAEVVGTVGLDEVAGHRAGGFSLGMRQRLGIAAALLGDPEVVLLDEPVNGLDPDGIRWIRGLLRGLAAEGRTVFVSSHLMSEMALTADHLVILGRGRLLSDVSMEEMTASATGQVRVWSLPFLPFYPGQPYIILNSTFYDFFDLTTAPYYNEEAHFSLDGYVLNALVLKKNGVIVDVLGDPSATVAKPILPSGGTLVRKSGTPFGSPVSAISEWDAYPKDSFQFLGRHQP